MAISKIEDLDCGKVTVTDAFDEIEHVTRNDVLGIAGGIAYSEISVPPNSSRSHDEKCAELMAGYGGKLENLKFDAYDVPNTHYVTDEMIKAAMDRSRRANPDETEDEYLIGTFLVMSAAKPEWSWDREQKYREATSKMLQMATLRNNELRDERDEARRTIDAWKESARHYAENADYYAGLVDRIGRLFGVEAMTSDDGSVQDSILRAKVPELVEALFNQVMQANDATGNHDYIGPTKPDPANPSRRVPVPDETHERFHKSVGDVLTGKVMPEARRQMQEALKNAPKSDTSNGASTSKPLPRTIGFGDDPRRMGFRQVT